MKPSEDDQLMTLLSLAYGEHDTGWPAWFKRTWDYGGCTHLGSGKHMGLWRELQRQLKRAPYFKAELQILRKDLLMDLNQSRSFCLPRAKVIQESQQLLKEPGFSAPEKQVLQKRMQRWQTGLEGEFNCLAENSRCNYGA